ncbi:MAG: hypothetical protein KDD02_07645 [Phaeodactylibacter sp.]|nr:hypothetical protein [Phaeodactylibacter sp.]MCB9304318.1 hypothetical protein [Lewinellaceae bacterium]
MELKFTPNCLIKYLYSETSAMERLGIDEAMAGDIGLREEYEGLLQAYQQLPKVTFSPSRSTIQGILKYSERTALEKQA